jgi:ribosomal-protein-alanine N-acetyltransferase
VGGEPLLKSERVYIRQLVARDAEPLLALRIRNRTFFEPYEPLHDDVHFTLSGQTEIIEKARLNWENGLTYAFGIFVHASDALIGRVNLSNVVRGAWDSCTIGYFLDEQHNGQGLMTEAVHLALEFAFDKANLHRVQAAVMPWNHASIRVLEKTGFRYEGMSEYYLKINDVWEHHNTYAITREYWK